MRKKRIILPKYTLLISVYDKELPENLNESLESMLMQTYPPSEVVLVCDGKLSYGLKIIAKSFQSEFRKIFKIIKIDEHVGVSKALNKGIEECTYPFIMKMDTDDMSYPDRCKKQMQLIAEEPDIDMVGTYVEVYDTAEKKVIGVKKTPVEHEDIVKFAKRRNPFCRQTVVFRTSLAKEIGGYSELDGCEDYDFAVRMIMNGAKCRNIPETLVQYRISDEDFKKFKNKKSTNNFIKVRKMIWKSGFSNTLDFIIPCAFQLMFHILPVTCIRKFYEKMIK